MFPFIIQSPFMYQGKMYTTGSETMLIANGFDKAGFIVALKSGKIQPNKHKAVWYRGPHCELIWEAGIYTEQDLRDNVVSGKKIEGIAAKRLKDVADHLGIKLILPKKKVQSTHKTKPVK